MVPVEAELPTSLNHFDSFAWRYTYLVKKGRNYIFSKNRVLPIAAAVWIVLAAPGCKKPASQSASGAPAPIPEVVVANVIQKDVPLFSNWVGTTEGFVNAKIYPKVSGYIVKQAYQDGDQVRNGQLLFQIDDREYKAALDQALGDLAQKKADLQRNQEDLARYQPLLKEQVISRQDFDHVNQATRASVAAVQSGQAAVATAKLNLEWARVTSPIDGIAGIAKAQVGDLVGVTTLLTTVSQLDPIKVVFPISEGEYLHFADKIKTHMEKGVTKDEPDLEMILADGSIYPQRGHFYAANRQIKVQTGTVKVEGVFPNHEYLLRPGLYAKIRVQTDVRKNVPLVPQSAVFEIQGQYEVAVVGADNKIALRSVTPGNKFEDVWVIDAGVKPGERVVAQGVDKVRDGMVVKPVLAGAPRAQATALGVTKGQPRADQE
jgi:membrane fusion protein (multidrug efflux system)